MDWQPVFNVLGAGVFAAIGWFIKGISDDTRQNKQDLYNFRVEVAKEYVTHSDLGDIKAALLRIEEKLDGKADK